MFRIVQFSAIKPSKLFSNISLTFLLGLSFYIQSAQAQAGTATGNLSVTMTITAGCTITAATLAFPSTPGTTLIATAQTANTTFTVTCSNTAPFTVGMSQGGNYLGGSNRMVSSGNFINYSLYQNAGLSTPWTTGATNSTCTTSGQCYVGTGTGSAQTLTVYGQVPTVAVAPAAGSYTDTVTMTVTY
jgi:spore coat protein U-like protein